MDVNEAMVSRRSVRAFTKEPVSGELVHELLVKAARAPSGGNLQPWHVHALTGARLKDLLNLVAQKGPDAKPGYAVYPERLAEPYRTRRFNVGEELYARIAIAREDKPARLRQLARNATFFGAPVGIFVFVDRRMGPPQWADLGMFVQSFMLLAVAKGLDTCPQEYWTLFGDTVERFLDVPTEQQLFCGIALGYQDLAAPINGLRTTRAPTDEWLRLDGFDSDR